MRCVQLTIAGPRCGEFDQARNEWVLLVVAPDQAGGHRRSVVERKRDHAGVGETAGDPVGHSGNSPPGDHGVEPLLGAGDVVGALRRSSALLIQRPKCAPLRMKVRAAGKRLVKHVGDR